MAGLGLFSALFSEPQGSFLFPKILIVSLNAYQVVEVPDDFYYLFADYFLPQNTSAFSLQVKIMENHKKITGTFTTWHKSQVLFYLLIAFIAGVFAASAVGVSAIEISALLIFGLVVLIFSKRRADILLAGFLVLTFVFGAARFNHADLPVEQESQPSGIAVLNILSSKFQESVNQSIPEPNASYINGILLGARQSIPKDLKEVFNRTSTTHILAISGYNITVIADAVLAGLVFCMRRRYAFWVSVVVIILFTLLTGASASVVRAAIMGLLFLFASGYGRLYDAKNSIVLAGAVMIYFNPRVLVFNIGFQLSFLAVLGLLYIYPVLKHLTIKWPDIFELKELALMTVSAQIAVAPLLAHYFRQFSLVSLPANILVLPFVPAVMLLGFLSGLGGLIFLPLGQLIGYVAWALSLYQIKVIQFLAALPLASLSFSFDWLLVALACALLIFAAYKLKNKYETI
ncbi:MAG: hypothetical protein A3C81_02775 [Candidatus Yanofskybacteria bacterium RIFCSPHIGHO2_02_FULL_46_19]|uniref:ComEC/Rec2-related protein domain-containing protein n=3 Tax=Candidatus Yanofskyibacteriota TaxID=1752733 RepID=A0A1F8H5U9_9BACT|nr:MAG: hypothetical protein A3C81_02775 [Candidatus Yanofskybacteria bacterium RIFCSPHIGHO2_02_FULL_46_19]OGN26826.1 MAG: hypothetical protein A3B17_00290 [Candidatus Yanofskybacteria bacterium RIFCSPLOWO2_01_FULL_45_72]OGN32388.1 MAG: hypothetical protein A3J01_00505 [Candidatus Yanofskybacteria bacterium RIFCSPLOWO2_02_FULL_45_18]